MTCDEFAGMHTRRTYSDSLSSGSGFPFSSTSGSLNFLTENNGIKISLGAWSHRFPTKLARNQQFVARAVFQTDVWQCMRGCSLCVHCARRLSIVDWTTLSVFFGQHVQSKAVYSKDLHNGSHVVQGPMWLVG